ncbi:MAG TPA: TetR/AcrR family transcriptional regulator [Candidatus Acidoferrum sp.]|nr:TetR/AcrR family transcriptional regulator [Candidatus Acidoferrum sp.]
MARPIEFDHDDVITRATDQFWKDGYVASSVQKLLDATGINRGTMYNSFGEKEAFFRSCVEHYNELLAEQIEATLANKALKPAAAVTGFFQQTVSGLNAARRSYGCLLVNSLCESIVWEEPLARLIRESLNAVRKSLLVRTRELEKSRGLAPRLTAEFAADQLLSLYQAVKLSARAGKSPRQLLDQVQFSLAAILK